MSSMIDGPLKSYKIKLSFRIKECIFPILSKPMRWHSWMCTTDSSFLECISLQKRLLLTLVWGMEQKFWVYQIKKDWSHHISVPFFSPEIQGVSSWHIILTKHRPPLLWTPHIWPISCPYYYDARLSLVTLQLERFWCQFSSTDFVTVS